jgi:hypothetical protein
MSTGDYLPWVLMDKLLVKSFGLTKAYDTFQSYSWLQIFMIAFPDTFIIDNSTGGARQWQGTWRFGRPRPLDRSVLIAFIRIGVDHQGHTVKAMGQRISQRLLHIQTLIGMRVECFRQLPVGHTNS